MRNDIGTRLKQDYDKLKDLGYDVMCVMLQGSQNYCLDYEGSDIDTKAIIIPSFEDIVLNKQPISSTIVLPSNEHLDVKDIRLMFECFRKQNINFLEVLFTPYYTCNLKYEEEFNCLRSHAEEIAHYNNYAAVKCITGFILEKNKALEHPYPSIIDRIEKYGYDPKQLHHILRCREFLDRYILGIPFEECLIPTDPDYLINVKRIPPCYSLAEARDLAKKAVGEAKIIEKNYLEKQILYINKDVDILLNDILKSTLRKHLIEELTN